MTKEFLDEIEASNNEIIRLKKRINNIESQEKTVVTDSVQGSGTEYPYIKHSCTIEGIKIPKNKTLKNKYKKMLKSKIHKLDKLKVQLEYELNYVKSSEIRDIIRYRYNDNKSWIQIMFLMKYNSENAARMKLKRFLEKK